MCKDGLLTADDGKCYACFRGTFNTITAICSCETDKNFISNAAGDGCKCDAGYLLKDDLLGCQIVKARESWLIIFPFLTLLEVGLEPKREKLSKLQMIV